MQIYINLQLKDMIQTIEYHEKIFGINENISISSYLNIRNEIFTLLQIFSSIDDNFSNETFYQLFDDVLSIISYFDKFKLTQEVTKKAYSSKPAEFTCSYEEFDSSYSKRFKELKQNVIKIISTKLYYLDLYLWKEAKKSSLIYFYLKQKNCIGIFCTKDYLLKSKVKKRSNISYSSFNYNIYTKYDEKTIDYIKSLASLQNKDEDPLINKLIASKSSIAFFKGMYDEDIRKIVKNISFIKYKMHETIIEENDSSKEIYYLLSGTVRVIVGTNALGIVEKGNIFGEFSSITGECRSATIKANDQSVTVLRFKFAFESFDDIPYSFTYLYKNIIDALIIKIHNSNTQKAKAENTMLNEISKKISNAKSELHKTNAQVRLQKKNVTNSN